MNNLRHVVSFEYMSVAKTKSFIITNIFFLVVTALFAFLPNIISFFGNDDEIGYTSYTNVAIVDQSGFFTQDVFERYIPHFDVVFYELNPNTFEELSLAVESEVYELVIHFVDRTNAVLIHRTNLSGPPSLSYIQNMLESEYMLSVLNHFDVPDQAANQIINVDIQLTSVTVGGAGFWVGYIAMFLIFFPLTFSGSMISNSVVSEKTSKTVELIFTSVSPLIIVVGKVIASSLLIATNFAVIILGGILFLHLSGFAVLDFFTPEVLQALLDPIVYIYVGIYFITAFISFAFLFASAASGVKDVQESSSAATIPTFLLLIAFYAGLGVSAGWLPSIFVTILSYIPFVSNFIMIVRITSFNVLIYEIIITLVFSTVVMIVSAIICSKIYKKNIMDYGTRRTLFSRLRKKA